MVGIAGRSRGCITCRKRHVKCDETHPSCLRCVKAGRDCAGYVLNNFVDGLPLSVRRKANKRAKSSASHGAQQSGQTVLLANLHSTEDDQGDVEEVSRDEGSLQLTQNPLKDPYAHFITNTPNHPAQSLGLGPFRDLIYMTYTATSLFKVIPTADELQWMGSPEQGEGGLGSGLAGAGYLSLSTYFFGVEHRLNDVVGIGRQRYGNALRILNEALADPDKNCSVDVLKTANIMTLFEFLEPTQKLGWVSHSLGLEQLFALRGPLAHKSGQAHLLFEHYRVPLIMACLVVEGKVSIFAEPEWKTLPWLPDLSDKSSLQYALDALADCTVLISERNRVRRDVRRGLTPTADYVRTIEKNETLLNQVSNLFKDWLEENGDQLKEVPCPTGADYTEQLPWSTVYNFPNLETAHNFAYLNAMFVFLLRCRSSLLNLSIENEALADWASDPTLVTLAGASPESQQNSIFSQSSPEAAIEDCRSRARKAAIEICRSVNYHLLEGQEGAGSLYLLFPIHMSWLALGKNSLPVGRWIEEVVQAIGQGQRGRWGCAMNTLRDD